MAIVIDELITVLLFATDGDTRDMRELENAPPVSLGNGMEDGTLDETDESVAFLGKSVSDEAIVTEKLPTVDGDENVRLAFNGCCVELLSKEVSEGEGTTTINDFELDAATVACPSTEDG